MGYREADGQNGFEYIPNHEGPFSGLQTLEERPESRTDPCKYVNITCKNERCGKQDLWKTTPYKPVDTDIGGWPWTASVFVDGEYACGATLIHDQFIITSAECMKQCFSWIGLRYVTVVVGQPSLTRMGENGLIGISPHANIRRVVRFEQLSNTQISLGKLEKSVVLTDYVGKLCISSISWVSSPGWLRQFSML